MRLRTQPTSKSVQLMLTCLADAFYHTVGRATVEVLEHAGCTVEFPENQTCCGQPAFNAGDWAASREVVRHTCGVFAGSNPIVVPSGSCAAMMFHGAPMEFEKERDLNQIEGVAERTWELADFLVNGLGVARWQGRFPYRIAFHTSCHSRGTKSGAAALALLTSLEGCEVLPFGDAEQCCGFGGAFSVTFPNISTAMGQLKIEHLEAVSPDYVVSADPGCILHLSGLINRQKRPLKVLHLAEVLAASLGNAENPA
jgi:L-lactate dehydrogenase complex protein LldE